MFHPKIPELYDGARSWSPEALPFHNPCWNTADDPNATFQDGGLPCIPCLIDIEHYLLKTPISVANEMCNTDAYEDTLTVDVAIDMLRNASVSGTPFYLAVGLHKPHIPYQAAQEDWDKHPLESITLPKRTMPPDGMPELAYHFSEDSEHANPWQPLSDNATRAARQGYAAALTGMDRKLGNLLAELESLGLTNDTAVVAHSDHG